VAEVPVSERDYFMSPATYDEVYREFTADVPHVVELIRQAGGPALEVCCGNGRLLLPALGEGFAVDGLDLDRAMLDDLRDKLARAGLSASLHQADMRDFSLPGRYALILIAFNSFLHNLTQEDQLATLRCCRLHLEPGGRLALITFHPSAEKLIEFSTGEHLVADRPLEGGRIRVFDHADDDRVEQTRHVTRRIVRLDAAGGVASEEIFRFRLRYIFKPEMELLLRVAGFSRWEVRPLFASYSDPSSDATGPGFAGCPAPREGDNLLWTAWA